MWSSHPGCPQSASAGPKEARQNAVLRSRRCFREPCVPAHVSATPSHTAQTLPLPDLNSGSFVKVDRSPAVMRLARDQGPGTGCPQPARPHGDCRGWGNWRQAPLGWGRRAAGGAPQRFAEEAAPASSSEPFFELRRHLRFGGCVGRHRRSGRRRCAWRWQPWLPTREPSVHSGRETHSSPRPAMPSSSWQPQRAVGVFPLRQEASAGVGSLPARWWLSTDL